MPRALGLAVLLAVSCGEGDSVTRLRVSGAFDPPSIDFGEVPIGLSRTITVGLMNTSQAPFTIDDVQDISGAFSIRAVDGLLEGLIVSAGTRVELEVSFISLAANSFAEPLIVKTREVDIPLQVSARGVVRMEPVFTVDPAVLDFGSVELGTTTRLTFAVKNVGNANGTLVSGALESGARDFALSVPWPLIVAPNVIGVFPIAFTPTRGGIFNERMLVGVGELQTPIAIELRGVAGADGNFFCTPSSITFGEVPRGNITSQTITCSARNGDVQLTGQSLTGDASVFSIAAAPPAMGLTAGQSVTYAIEFRPDGLPMPHSASLAIEYLGNTGPATLTIPLNGTVGVPPPTANAISVILTWDKDFTDVDLHLVRPGGSTFTLESDCFWASKAPDWGAPGVQTDNPFLDVDDIDGYGPETINLRQTGAGSYGVFAHHYADRKLGPTAATAEIYIGGTRVGTYSTPSLACNDLWNIGTVEWNGSSGSFTPAGAVMATQSGNCE
jgi:hypothetical protein